LIFDKEFDWMAGWIVVIHEAVAHDEKALILEPCHEFGNVHGTGSEPGVD